MKEQSHFTAILLAAGKGTRMKSVLPKVLHPAAGEPMIRKVLKAVKNSGVTETRVVLGHGKDLIDEEVQLFGGISFVQINQWGTADAVKAAQPETIEGLVIILNGDHPLMTAEDIQFFRKEFLKQEADLAVISVELEDPGSFGRIVRHKGDVRAIVEAKDASSSTLDIREVNSGIYVVDAEVLNEYLPQIQSHNAQNEFYLTDIVSLCVEDGKKVIGIKGGRHVAFGVNNQKELSEATKILFKKKCAQLMENGVTIIDPDCTYIEEEVEVGASSVLYPGVHLKGKTQIGSFCVLEAGSQISNSQIGNSTVVKAYSYIEGSKIGANCAIGPFAHLRPDSELSDEVKIGNFVETKKVKLGKGVKASHLTYLGDAEVGEKTNIGCGTITCNYAPDHKKYKTVIGKNVFVGSDTQFVAPVKIGDGALIGSGSTITKDVPANALAVARGKQVIKEDYAKRFDVKE